MSTPPPDEAESQIPWDDESIEWHCICGSGDRAEWHTFLCAAHNTPDDVFYSDTTPAKDQSV